MRRLAAPALVLTLLAIPVFAQHGGGHGGGGFSGAHAGGFSAPRSGGFSSGFASHTIAAPRAGFAQPPAFRSSAPRSFSASRTSSGFRTFGARPTLGRAVYPGISSARPAFYNHRPPGPVRSHRPNRFWRGTPFLYSGFYYPSYFGSPGYFGSLSYCGFGWYDDSYLDCSDSFSYPDDPYYGDPSSADAAANSSDQLAAYSQDGSQPEPDPQSFAQSYSPAPPDAPVAQATAQPVTLIFKDGRPPEQITNFIETRTTISIIDGQRHRDVPIEELDLAATINANRQAGVDFSLPGTAN